MAESKTLTLGTEYEDDLRDALVRAVERLGGAAVRSSRGMAGSQTVETHTLDFKGRHVTVEAETYVGLSITGPADLVDAVASAIGSEDQE